MSFTKHVRRRLKQRQLNKNQIMIAIEFGKRMPTYMDRWLVNLGKLIVVINDTHVVTAYEGYEEQLALFA